MSRHDPNTCDRQSCSRPLCAVLRCAVLGAAALCSAAPVQAAGDEVGIDLTVGRARQRDGDRLLSLGANLSWRPAGWWVAPEVGYETKLFPLFAGEDREVTAGLRLELPLGPTGRFLLGGGYARLRMDWGANVDSRNGWYARAGAMWPVGSRGFWMGVEGKVVRGDDYQPWGVPTRSGADRIGLLMAWRI